MILKKFCRIWSLWQVESCKFTLNSQRSLYSLYYATLYSLCYRPSWIILLSRSHRISVITPFQYPSISYSFDPPLDILHMYTFSHNIFSATPLLSSLQHLYGFSFFYSQSLIFWAYMLTKPRSASAPLSHHKIISTLQVSKFLKQIWYNEKLINLAITSLIRRNNFQLELHFQIIFN